ncbi:uncharacterized protein LOC126215051 [Schistocerca nitens]|uniref:uncharacterized protein LOC126215051 n=1 Tax=Schistocerca nitens TaxID=7011 RepID=UPI002119324F|nr:uncharacterized protein LOC126215051 [Schistocerca nitens]
MGVDGLSKYAKDHRLYQEVDIQAVANDFRSSNVGQPVIAVDGSQCAWYLYANMDSLHGGQYKEFRESCEQFVERFHGMGIKLSFFFDGLPVEEKILTWVKRRADKAKEISKIFAKLRAMQSRENGFVGCRFLPEAVVPLATVTFKHLGSSKHLDCEVRLSTNDCDTELAKFAASDRCCIGVLSNDSDFLIYPNVPCLFTFSNLRLGQRVTGWRFRSTDLARHLGIEVDDLPVLASFMGNDIVRREALQEAHRKLRQTYRHRQVAELVAELLRRPPRGDLRRMCELAFGGDWRKGLELVEKSVDSYKYEEIGPATTRNVSRWDAVLQEIEAKHVSCEIPGYVYTVMKCRLMRAGDVLEDLSVSCSTSPPTGLVVREMLQRMYTVLLWESGSGPFRVTEYIPTGLGELHRETVEVQKRLPEGIHHPGLVELWSGAEDTRWRIFSWVISPTKDLSALCSLSPQYLVVPAAALCFLYHEAKVLTRDEVKTFVTVALSVKSYSAHDLSRLDVRLPTERAIYLATLFVRTVLHVLDVAGACGLSFPRPADCHLDAYFDGRLFHHIYRKSQNASDPRDVVAWSSSGTQTFNYIMRKIID